MVEFLQLNDLPASEKIPLFENIHIYMVGGANGNHF